MGRDGWAGLICLAGSLGLLLLSRGLPTPALVPIGPGFYPRIVLGVTAVLAAALLLQQLLRRRRRRPTGGPVARPNYRLVSLTFGLFAAYVLLMPRLGFRLSTFLFVLAVQWALEPARPRPWLRMGLVAAGATLLTYLAFERYLSVLLPLGRWTGF